MGWLAPTNPRKDPDRQVSYLGRQLDAALAATGSQDGAAGTGTHTKAEAVLLGPTAVIRLKSPLAHVSYSSGSKVRPPDQKGKNWPTLSFVCACRRCLPHGERTGVQLIAKADTKDFTTLGQKGTLSQTDDDAGGCPQLWQTGGSSLWMNWLTTPGPEQQPCNYPQATSQLSSGEIIP